MIYSDLITVNKNFQSSINLELDLGKESKVAEYIPTTDICDVIKKYIKSFLGYTRDNATALIGPYGKGKSFLLLVLSYLVGKNKNTESWMRLVSKIGKVDPELYDMLLELKEKDISLLPVLINSNYDNLTQSFRLALNDALKRENLSDIIPDSVFDVCLKLIKKWSINEGTKDEIYEKCLQKNKINIKELKKGLSSCSPVAYKQFENLYNCVNIGLAFNPLVNNDIVKTYSDTVHAVLKRGYSGIFIIFDEFSKFLESNSSNLMKDLKIIQDFAELSSRSGKKSQINLCCVAHKSLSLYKEAKNQSNLVDSFKTVEGRFKEIRFNRSLNENYQIISAAIIKKGKAEEFIQKRTNENADFYDGISALPVFNNKGFQNVLYRNCFPLNPITVYSLIEISELVAQNERTLFTFLSDTDDDSFNSFIHSHSKGLFDIDKIYDYFNLLLKSSDDERIRNLWYRTESILSKLENPIEKRIVKALSIILAIDNQDSLPANLKTISLSLEIDEGSANALISSLIDKHLLRKNALNSNFSFALSNSKQIDDALIVLRKTKCKNIRLNEIADQINEKKYILPREYNEKNKITRFFKPLFLSESDFLNIPSFDYYFEDNYCDGVVIYLLSNTISQDEIKSKLAALNDKRVVVKFSKKTIPSALGDLLTTYACLTELKKQKNLDEVTQAQIDLITEETISDAHSILNDCFESDFGFESILMENGEAFNHLLSRIVSEIYTVRLVFNNELINKKLVTTQYQKAINHVIDWLLNGSGDFNYSETSPEMSVKVAILDENSKADDISSNNFRKVIDQLKKKIVDTEEQRIIVKDIIKFLSQSPYGIRDGVLPVLFAKAISELSDNAILYFQRKEIELNANNLVKALFNEKYQISFARGAANQNTYLNKMIRLFNVVSSNNFRKDTFALSKGINRFFIRMPQVIRICSLKNNFLGLDNSFIAFKDLFLAFDINPYEAIFQKPLEIFHANTYEDTFLKIQTLVNHANSLLNQFYAHIKGIIRETFSIDDNTSLKSGFHDFLESKLKNKGKPIFEEKNRQIYEFLCDELTYSDDECAAKLVKIITGQSIEDWDSNKTESFKEALNNFKTSISSSTLSISESSNLDDLLNKKYELNGVSSLLRNNLESVLDEFSGSVTSSDKINVLLSLLKEIL